LLIDFPFQRRELLAKRGLSNMQDIREVLARAAGEGKEERLDDSSLRIEARSSGDDEPEEKR